MKIQDDPLDYITGLVIAVIATMLLIFVMWTVNHAQRKHPAPDTRSAIWAERNRINNNS